MSGLPHDPAPRSAAASGSTWPPRLVIVGGGITGLAAAHRAVECAGPGAIEVCLLEASPRTGGVIATEHSQGFTIEGGPDSFVAEKPQAVELCRRLGLGDTILPSDERYRSTLVVRDGRLVPLPEAFQLLAPASLLPFLRSPILSLRGRVAALRDLLAPRGAPPPGGDESLASFVRRRLGQEVLDRIAQPMVGGIYTADPETLSLAATMPRFLEMERRDRSVILALHRAARSRAAAAAGRAGTPAPLFVTLRDGLGSLARTLEARLPEGTIRTGARVVAVRRETTLRPAARPPVATAGGQAPWTVVLSDGAQLPADAVLIALPAPRAAEALEPLDRELAAELAAIRYASSATVSLAYWRHEVPHPLEAFGLVVPEVEQRRIVACTFCSVKYPGRTPSGTTLLRAFVGGAMHPELFALGDETLLAAVREELRSLLGIRAEPLLVRFHRWPESMPQYRVGHLRRVARIRELAARMPGFALAGNAYDGVGVSDCVRTAEAAVDRLLEELGAPGAGQVATGDAA